MSMEICTADQFRYEEYSPPTWHVYFTVYESDRNNHIGMCKYSYFTVFKMLQPETKSCAKTKII